MSEATLHSVAGPAGVTEAANLVSTHRALVGPFEKIVHRVAADVALLEEATRELPGGAAQAEAIAVRLRRLGVELAWGEPDELPGPKALIELAHARGRSSIEVLRADPTLLTQLQLGAWCQSGLRHRLARRVPLPRRGQPALLRAAVDRAFWLGAHRSATREEWRRLTASYGALVYHRLAGEGKPGQERVDLDPGAHARTHRGLTGLSPADLRDEVSGSLADLRARLHDPLPLLAYPNGRHDEAVRAAAVAADFRAAWTTVKGRNGLGTDRWCLRRVSVHAGDGPLAVLWKVATGEPPPRRRQ